MNNILLLNIKELMLYIRNDTRLPNLYEIVLCIKDSVLKDNNDLLLDNMSYLMPNIVLNTNKPDDLFVNKKIELRVERFLIKSLDVMLDATLTPNELLLYDLADMLQGVPNLEYWKNKNIRTYWKNYVTPFSIKWKIKI